MYVEIHQVIRLVFDNYQLCPVSLNILCIISTHVMYSDEGGRFKAIVTVEEVKSEISFWES